MKIGGGCDFTNYFMKRPFRLQHENRWSRSLPPIFVLIPREFSGFVALLRIKAGSVLGYITIGKICP
jgi:hypothetical protein